MVSWCRQRAPRATNFCAVFTLFPKEFLLLRFADVLRFATTALLQQKTRSVLTTLGVLFGTFVLVISLSLRLGTEQALLGMFRRHNELRMIRVYPGSAPRSSSIPEDQLQVRGDMSAGKKDRLHEMLLRQWHAKNGRQVVVPLTRECFDRLTALNHVESVVPVHYAVGRAKLEDKSEDARAYALPADAPLEPFIVAGRALAASDDHAVLINEFLLYRLGIRDDADVQRAIGRPLRLEYRSGARNPNLLLALLNSRASAELAPAGLLEKIISQLPKALTKLDLTPAERASLKKLFEAPQPRSDEMAVVSEDLIIAGVFRAPTKDDPRSTVGTLAEQADLFVPVKAAQDLFFRLPEVRASGLSEAAVMADSEQNVQGVLQEVRALGLNGFAPLEHVEHDRYIFALMLSVMTCVAAVAILVAAFGITNTMLMSVLERQREIGIMKAVGARERDIQRIFLVEGAVIGVLGSSLGLLLGYAASFPGDAWMRSMIEGQTPLPVTDPLFIFPPWLVLAIPPVVVLVTILAAALPARRAVRMDPVGALRHE
jgi:putative ABC transport system permease protein